MEKEELKEMLDSFKTDILSQVKEITGAKEDPSPPAPKSKTPDSDLVTQIVAALEEKNKTSSQEVYDTMFNEKVTAMTTQFPAFGDYLNSTDDFGDVILDRIKGIGDYQKRINAFDTVFKSFASAQSSTSNDMRMSKEMKEKVKRDTDEADKVKEKFFAGEMGLEDFAEQYFATIGTQIEELANMK